MSKVLGYVEVITIQNGLFYNLKPVAVIKDNAGNISMQDEEAIVQDSELAQINLGFNPNNTDDLKTMRTMFDNSPVVVFEFTKDDLSYNYDKKAFFIRGESRLRPVPYRVDAMPMIRNGKIRSINTEGLYYSISSEDVLSDLINDNAVKVKISNLTPGEQALVEYEDMWTGPYEVGYDEETDSYYIKPEVKVNKYTIKGYNEKDVKPVTVSHFNERSGALMHEWKLVSVKEPENIEIKDVSTDEILIDEFKTCLQCYIAEDELITPDNFTNLLEQNRKSFFSGSPLTEKIRQDRLRRVQELFNLETECVFKKITDVIIPVLVKHKKNEYNACKKEVDQLEERKKTLELDIQHIEQRVDTLIEHSRDKLADIAFDGYITSKILHAAGQWEEKDTARQNEVLLNGIRELGAEDKDRDEVIDYICRTVQLVRPAYGRNTIINIAICLTQGFLTVFSGEPGCGKTSICNIFSEVLGLNKLSEYIDCQTGSETDINRYVPVSVERGWTSKRDFVGYYNPLSKTFDKSNRKVYDALHQLDAEKRNDISTLPFIILLDEANLSPMEYYWSDFMNICDDLGPQSTVNLGENYVFGIPETLHFVATINNDHTTETLSPRLIDRASIILLPHQSNVEVTDKAIPAEEIELVTWTSLSNAFIPEAGDCAFTDEIQEIYDEVIEKLREQRIAVSPRVDRAIRRYWSVASECFEEDEDETEPDIIALDYAIAQRILPRFIGSGEPFKTWLEELQEICTKHELKISAKILKDILDHGNDQMMYYQFFF